MKISDLIRDIELISATGDMGKEISSMAYDSRKVEKGALFLAISGLEQDGHDYIDEAMGKGAVAFVIEKDQGELECNMRDHPTVLRVENSRKTMAEIAARFYGFPSQEMSVIGITGTNGKTTTSLLVDSIVRESGNKSGVIGTVNCRINNDTIPTSHTTPESPDLQGLLRKMADQSVKFCTLEVSSHALELNRVVGVSFHTALFTNLTRDHLDFHKDMESYRKAKEKLFLQHKPAQAVVNIDDETGKSLAEKISCPILTFGLRQKADIRGDILLMDSKGTRMKIETPIGSFEIRSALMGRHNVYNILSAVGVGIFEGFTREEIMQGVSEFRQAPGRFEPVNEGQPFTVLVDYAHTEDALENALKGAGEITKGKLIVVFGCGGDRDRGKRSAMGRVAANLADLVVITSDNPRSEDPGMIIEDIEVGLSGEKKYRKIADRREAIEYAVSSAKANDMVLIAGKGHEDYQILGKTRIHFDDREVVRESLKKSRLI